ncbi:hypothetical protein [Streptomyces sp. NPDC051173]|uniref:hypothetical protein n=1 Tax=Streptomyces sp. NPDC051173 TaxID=3155164 RepID=UPI00344C2E4C
MKYRLIALLAGVLALSGCGATGDGVKGEVIRMNMQQGAEFSDKVLDETLAAVAPPVKWTHGETTDGSCRGSNTGSITRRRAVMTLISEQRRGNFLGVVERYWKSRGYEITDTAADKEFPAIFASAPGDFRMSLEFGDKGQAFFDVTTPCLQESEVSPPKSETNGPNYAGSEIPYPDQRSDFWSAGTPMPSSTPSKESH